jgi:hypothetical protein
MEFIFLFRLGVSLKNPPLCPLAISDVSAISARPRSIHPAAKEGNAVTQKPQLSVSFRLFDSPIVLN